MLLKIAWRNIWRNKRRTLITAASIFFAVLFAVAIESMNRGIFDKMINDSVRFYKGYGQVSQKGYFEEGSLDLAFAWTPQLEQQLLAVEGIQGVVPRLEGFALASHQKITKSALLVGIEPSQEDQLTGLKKRLVKGQYLQAGQEAVLLGEGLAQKLKLDIGDTLVLISQGYRGVNAAGKYPIQGIISFGSPEWSAKMVYLPLKAAQWFFGADKLVTTAILDIPNKTIASQAIPQLQNQLDTNTYEVLDWKARMPELLEMKELKQSSNVITLFILYLIVSFGIFGVILMMTKERQKEFGILLSIGMKRGQLALITWLETLFLGFFFNNVFHTVKNYITSKLRN